MREAPQTFQVICEKACDVAKWDAFVHSRDDAGPYHLSAWGRSVAAAYGHDPYHLSALDGDRVIGILPVVHLKLLFSRGSLVSLPFCDFGAAVAATEPAAAALHQRVVQLGADLGVDRLEFRADGERSCEPRLDEATEVHSRKVRMVLPLPGASGQLWESFRSKLRSQIRKAEKNGLDFRWGTAEDTDAFYQVFSQNMRDLGSPVHSRDWIRAVLENYGGSARLGLVLLDHNPVGAGIILFTQRMVSIPWASTLREHNRLSPNMLLYWKFLEFAADGGYSHFDFGRSTPDEGTYKFKAQWGAEPRPLRWHTVALSDKVLERNPGPSMARARAENMWRKLPLPIANWLGPRVRRYISL